MSDENLLPCDGRVRYFSKFIEESHSLRLFQELLEEIPWKKEKVKIFGKEMWQPRLVSWHGDQGAEYSYSNHKLKREDWSSALLELREKVEAYSGETYNSVLLNLYRNQQDSNGWHSDDEKELGENPSIASLSFGQERDFLLKHKKEKDLKKKIKLENGSLLIMDKETQAFWKHCLPKRAGSLDPRINLTFRKIIG